MKIKVFFTVLFIIVLAVIGWIVLFQHHRVGRETRKQILSIVNNAYDSLYPRYALQTAYGVFITDPSQADQIVSESQTYWLKITVQLAELKPERAAELKKNFDAILQGTMHMVRMAQKEGSMGEFPAWKVIPVAGEIVLAQGNNGLTVDSASDADLDLIFSLIKADNIWGKSDKSYQKLADRLISHAQNTLFNKRFDRIVLKPSQDWDSFLYTDYLSPGTFKLIAEYLGKSGAGRDRIAFWDKAAVDSVAIYSAILESAGQFPSQVSVSVKPDGAIEAMAINSTVQSFDGIRSPYRIAEGLVYGMNDSKMIRLAKKALDAGVFNNYTKPEIDNAMYLPLAVVLGDSRSTQLLLTIYEKPEGQYYYDNSLRLLAMQTVLLAD